MAVSKRRIAMRPSRVQGMLGAAEVDDEGGGWNVDVGFGGGWDGGREGCC